MSRIDSLFRQACEQAQHPSVRIAFVTNKSSFVAAARSLKEFYDKDDFEFTLRDGVVRFKDKGVVRLIPDSNFNYLENGGLVVTSVFFACGHRLPDKDVTFLKTRIRTSTPGEFPMGVFYG